MSEQLITLNGYGMQIVSQVKDCIHKQLYRVKDTYNLLNFYAKDHKLYLLALVVFSMLLGLMETFQIVLLYPILNASFDLTDAGIPFFEPMYDMARTYINLPEVVSFCLLFILFVILTFLATITHTLLSLQFTKAVIVRTKEKIFHKLKESDYQYYVDNKQGDVLYNVVSSPGNINSFLDSSTLLFSNIVVIITILFALFLISPLAMTVLLSSGIIFVFFVRFIGNRVSYLIGAVQMQSLSSENTVISQYIQGLRQIRSVHADSFWERKYITVLRTYWDRYVRYRFTERLPVAFLQMFFFIGIAGVVIILYYTHSESFVSILPLIGTFAFSGLKILPRLGSLGSLNTIMMNTYPSLERIYNFLNDTRYNTIRNGTVPFEELTSDIVFEDVGFQYYKEQDLIENVNLNIHKNKVTALVGHSGSGKSTVISLLLRYYDVTDGRIAINGIDLREYDIATFLAKVGYVSQDTFIYNASVRENIAFGGDYTDDQIIAAAQRANIHAFITSLRDGYDSIVGDQGLKLSGGEKQRIAITRALVREPEILVLDEATSNLDNESEAIVQASINQISETITTFIIAHRLSTIRRADTIYVMSKGRIVESGGHEELLEMKGKYWELYEKGV